MCRVLTVNVTGLPCLLMATWSATGPSSVSSPAAVFASKVKLVELAISAQRSELHRCRAMFLRDVAALQDELGIKSREIEALHIELHAVRSGAAAAAAKTGSSTGAAAASSASPRSKKSGAADSNWQCHTDPGTGRPYYFNSATQESTWEKPAELVTPGAQSLLCCLSCSAFGIALATSRHVIIVVLCIADQARKL